MKGKASTRNLRNAQYRHGFGQVWSPKFENNMLSINSGVVFLTEISNMTSKWGKPNYKDGTVSVLS